MTNEELLRITERISNTTATEEEIFKYNAWCNSFRGTEQEIPHLEAIKKWNLQQIQHTINHKPKILSLYAKQITVAAALLVVFGIGLFYFIKPDKNLSKLSTNINDIRPGKHTATLTLSNGKIIKLSEAKTGLVVGSSALTYNDGSELATMQTEQLTATTPRGGTYQLKLPDGTRVWLNAASSLNFPSKFTGEKRMVILTGEAYFQVAKDSRHPFVVQSNGQDVQVLGTQFNISSYIDEPSVKTTLLEGSVRITGNKTSDKKPGKTILRPGQQSTFVNNSITVAEVNTSEAIAWKNGEFIFNDESIASIMRKIARWYDVEVVYEGIDQNEKFWGSISRFENVSKVLENLQLTGGIQFEIKGRKLYVRK